MFSGKVFKAIICTIKRGKKRPDCQTFYIFFNDKNIPEVLVIVQGVSDHKLVRDFEPNIVRGVPTTQGGSFPQ